MKHIILFILLIFFIAGIFRPPTPVIAQPSLPESTHIQGIVGHPQTYSLSCESRSAADVANYWRVPVVETTFFSQLPASDNPDIGFVGNVHDVWGQTPPYSYGVHAAPVADLLRKYQLDASEQRGIGWDDLRAEIAAGRPVIVWLISTGWAGTPQLYTAQDGTVTTVASYEHTSILIGYDQSSVSLIDAYTGQIVVRDLGSFLNSWAVLGNMAVFVRGAINMSVAPPTEPDITLPYLPQPMNSTYLVQSGDYLFSIATRFRIDWQQLAQINNIPWPYQVNVGQVLQIPQGDEMPASALSPTPDTYTVQYGDTLGLIAQRYGLYWPTVAQLNGIPWPYYVYSGQELRLR